LHYISQPVVQKNKSSRNMRVSAISLLLFGATAPVTAQVVTFGTNPAAPVTAITGENTLLSEMEGAMAKLDCYEGTFMATMSKAFPPIGAKWYNANGDAVGQVMVRKDVSSVREPLLFDLDMMGGCTGPILTLDVRAACNFDTRIVFDYGQYTGSPGSSWGNLVISGGDCLSPVEAMYDCSVAIGTNEPVGDLWQLLTVNFRNAGCTFENGPAKISADTDSTPAVPGQCDTGMDGDPHVKTWSGKHFDYMGQCDLVLLHAPNFDNGKNLDIHTRTTIRHGYSYIESAAISIDGEVLEVSSYGEHALNGVDGVLAASSDEQQTIGGYPIYYTQVNKKRHHYDLVLSPKENITFVSFKDLVAVHMNSGQSHVFFNEDVRGIMGSIDGALVGRDGTDMSDDVTAFAEEWQVRDFEPMLFRNARAPQYPSKCNLPSSAKKESRGLGATIARAAAETACSHFAGNQFDNCVYDIMAVGDLEMAEAGAV
jgi:hypothetical protein